MSHGVSTSQASTSILAPATTSASLPVVFGTAPVNLSKHSTLPVHVPVLCYSWSEAVNAFGYSDDFEKYTLSEFMDSHYRLFEQAPVVFVNVLDPTEHKTTIAAALQPIADKAVTIEVEGIMNDDSLVVKSEDGATTYQRGRDYVSDFNDAGFLVLSIPTGSTVPESATKLNIGYNKLDPSAVTEEDIIGGMDAGGKVTGLELIQQVFPRFRILPGLVVAPGFSQEPAVAAVMTAKAGNINGHFKAMALTDLPADTITTYTDAPAWKNDNNYTSERIIPCYPKVSLGGKTYNLATQLAGDICMTDAANGGVPYVSPSNKKLNADAAVLQDGTEMFLGIEQANYLNANGIVTALNFVGGWVAWGNRTGAYPAVTDPVQSFIPVRRMFDWVANTIILTYWQKVDNPANKRLIETVTDSINIWLNGLQAAGMILGGRVTFNKSENPATDLMDGKLKFHLYLTPPSPAEEIHFILEYDPQYLASLAV